MGFQPDRFAALLKQAIGNRTQKEFAAQASISIAHLSRMLKQHYKTAPNLTTLQKIAAIAENNISYRDLLQVCGYAFSFSGASLYASSTLEKKMRATLLSSLSTLTYAWQVSLEKSAHELCISLPDNLNWHFFFLNTVSKDDIVLQMNGIYTNLVCMNASMKDKFSLVTESEIFYTKCIKRLPINLRLNLSLILLNTDQLKVLRETWLAVYSEKLKDFCLSI